MFIVKIDSNQWKQLTDALNTIQSNQNTIIQNQNHIIAVQNKILLTQNVILFAILSIIVAFTIYALWRVSK